MLRLPFFGLMLYVQSKYHLHLTTVMESKRFKCQVLVLKAVYKL